MSGTQGRRRSCAAVPLTVAAGAGCSAAARGGDVQNLMVARQESFEPALDRPHVLGQHAVAGHVHNGLRPQLAVDRRRPCAAAPEADADHEH